MADTNSMMFNPMLNGPDAYAQQLALQRQQQLADLLTQQGNTPINPIRHAGGVNGGAGYVVPISPLEGLSHVGQALAGALMQRGLNQKQADISRMGYAHMQQLMRQMTGDMTGTAPAAAAPPPADAGGSVGADGAPAPVVTTPQSADASAAPVAAVPGGASPYGNKQQLAAVLMGSNMGLKVPDALVAQALPTNEARNYSLPPQAYKEAMIATGGNDALARQLMLGAQRKAGTIDLRPNNMGIIPGMGPVIAPDPEHGISTQIDANGGLSQAAIPGAVGVQAARAGALKGAESGATFMPMGQGPGGNTIYGQPAGAGIPGSPAPRAPAGPAPAAATATAPGVAAPAGARLPAPAGGAPAPFLSEYEKSRQAGAGKDFSEYEKNLNGRVSTGQAITNRANEILPLLEQFKTGSAGADARVKLGLIADSVGLHSLGKSIAGGDISAAQELEKQFVQGAMESLKQAISSDNGAQGRMTQAEFKIFQEANPNLETRPDAVRKILDFSQRIYSKDFAEQQALQQARQTGKFDPVQWPAQYAGVRNQQLQREAPKPAAPNPADVQAELRRRGLIK